MRSKPTVSSENREPVLAEINAEVFKRFKLDVFVLGSEQIMGARSHLSELLFGRVPRMR